VLSVECKPDRPGDTACVDLAQMMRDGRGGAADAALAADLLSKACLVGRNARACLAVPQTPVDKVAKRCTGADSAAACLDAAERLGGESEAAKALLEKACRGPSVRWTPQRAAACRKLGLLLERTEPGDGQRYLDQACLYGDEVACKRVKPGPQ
jgi:TPR repeat protein